MVLARLGARHVRALIWSSRPVCPLLLISSHNGPLQNVPALASRSSLNATDSRTGNFRLYSIVPELHRSSRSLIDHSSKLRWLRSAPTLDAWSQQLRSLDDRILADLKFWDEAFPLAQAKFQYPGVHATFKALLNSGHGPSETLSLYNSRHFPSSLLPGTHVSTHSVASETFQKIPEALELSYLRDFCSYMLLEVSKFGRKPSEHHRVYNRIQSRVLSIDSEQLSAFHNLLSPLGPSRSDVLALIIESRSDPQKQEALRTFCFTLPILKDAYDDIVPQMCQLGLFQEALMWHKVLTRHDQGPRDPTVLKPLIQYLHISKQSYEAEKLERLMKDSSIPELERIAASIEKRFPQGRIPRAPWTDEKSARIYATRFLSLNAVVSSLSLFNVHEIGFSSVREILLRCLDGGKADIDTLRNHFKLLEREGIAVDRSAVYCRLAMKLLDKTDAFTLRDLANTDIHPSVFDDINTLNSIFIHLDPTVEARKWHLIVNALLVDTSFEAEDSEYWNLSLRRSITRNDDEAVHEALNEMQASRVSATRATLQLMYQKFMRQPNSNTIQSFAEVDRFAKILCSLMTNGSFVSPSYWDDLLRTMLLLGDLDAHETLCLRIASLYKDERYQGLGEVEKVLYPLETSTQRGVLFRPQCINEILMYYMFYGRLATEPSLQLSKSQTAKVRAGKIASHPVFRGFRLLLHLRESGIEIDIKVIQRIFRTRIRLVCRTGCKLTSGVVVKRLDNALERDYHLAAELLIGARDPLLRHMKFSSKREKRPFASGAANDSSMLASEHKEGLGGDSIEHRETFGTSSTSGDHPTR